MEKKYKVKIMRSTRYTDIYDDCCDRTMFYPAAGDWEEVTQKEYNEINEAVTYANAVHKKNIHYFVIEYGDEIREEVFSSARDFVEKQRKQKELEEKRAAEAKRKREEKAIERKKKQLEKLKKELGENG